MVHFLFTFIQFLIGLAYIRSCIHRSSPFYNVHSYVNIHELNFPICILLYHLTFVLLFILPFSLFYVFLRYHPLHIFLSIPPISHYFILYSSHVFSLFVMMLGGGLGSLYVFLILFCIFSSAIQFPGATYLHNTHFKTFSHLHNFVSLSYLDLFSTSPFRLRIFPLPFFSHSSFPLVSLVNSIIPFVIFSLLHASLRPQSPLPLPVSSLLHNFSLLIYFPLN